MSLANYQEVKDRLPKFWHDHPSGRIETEMVEWRDDQFVVVARLYRDDDPTALPASTGWAHEKLGGSGANQQAALENCETSAIGRALSNWRYAADGSPRPSAEEMRSVVNGLCADHGVEDVSGLLAAYGGDLQKVIEHLNAPNTRSRIVERFGGDA